MFFSAERVKTTKPKSGHPGKHFSFPSHTHTCACMFLSPAQNLLEKLLSPSCCWMFFSHSLPLSNESHDDHDGQVLFSCMHTCHVPTLSLTFSSSFALRVCIRSVYIRSTARTTTPTHAHTHKSYKRQKLFNPEGKKSCTTFLADVCKNFSFEKPGAHSQKSRIKFPPSTIACTTESQSVRTSEPVHVVFGFSFFTVRGPRGASGGPWNRFREVSSPPHFPGWN